MTERNLHRGVIAWHRKTRRVWVLEWALGAGKNTQHRIPAYSGVQELLEVNGKLEACGLLGHTKM